jgi:hypothetical protein
VTATTTAVDMFAEVGVIAFRQGALTDALHELTVRVDLAGGGDLLAEFARTCWTPRSGGNCSCCGATAKGTPDPHPKPPPPPPPPPPGK